MASPLHVTTKYEFTSLDSNDLIDKIRARLELIGLTTEYAATNVISGATLGKRLHMKTTTGIYLNFASGLNRSPVTGYGTTNENWVAGNTQAVAATISRTLNTGLAWYLNESKSDTEIACAYTENNGLTRIFTTSSSIIIITNYAGVYYNTLYINFDDAVILSSTACLGSTVPKTNNGMIFEKQTYKPSEIIFDSSFYSSVGNSYVGTYENQSEVPFYSDFYKNLYNLINKASASLPLVIYFMNDDGDMIFIDNPLDLGIINMKNVDAGFIFDINGEKFQAFPNYLIDISSDTSMGYLLRIA